MTKLNIYEAAAYLGISHDVLEKSTIHAPKTNENRVLKKEPETEHGLLVFKKSELDSFDQYLKEDWPVPEHDRRANIPKYFKQAVQAESDYHCAICTWTNAVEVAHIAPWAATRNNHPHNLIALCPNHHTQYDYGYKANDLTLDEIKRKKNDLIQFTKAHYSARVTGLKFQADPQEQEERLRQISLEVCAELLAKEKGKQEVHIESTVKEVDTTEPRIVVPEKLSTPNKEKMADVNRRVEGFWARDFATKFIEDAYYNVKCTHIQHPELTARIRALTTVWDKLCTSLKNNDDLISALSIYRTHSMLLASIRLGLAGQFPEAYLMLNGALTHSLYASHFHGNKPRELLFLQKNRIPESRAAAQQEFQEEQLLLTLQTRSVIVEKYARELLMSTRESGVVGENFELFSNTIFSKDTKEIPISYLYNSPMHLLACLKTIARVQICCLLIVETLYPERFKIMGITYELRDLMNGL